MHLFEKWNLKPASMTRGLSKAMSHSLKTPFGHGISTFARKASDFTHKVSETFQELDQATGGELSALGKDLMSAIPGAGAIGSAIKHGKKAFAAAKMVGASLKRARAEALGNAALADGDPFRKRKRSIR
jgi:hypothetical protein